MDLNLFNVKFGLLTAVEIEEQIFTTWRNTLSIPIDWLPPNNIDSVDHIENKIFQEYYIVEKFYLDKQLFVGKRGSFDPIRPIRGIAHRPVEVRYKLSSKDIVLNFFITFAYFKPHKVLQVFLFTNISNILIDDLIFIKQSKWYQVEGEGWKLSVNYTGKQPETINQICNKVLEAYRIHGHKHNRIPDLFAKNRQKIRKEWSLWYKQKVGFVPSLYSYTCFSNEMPCIGDGVLLLVERCLLRYIELTRMYEQLIDLRRFVAIKRVFNKLIWQDKDSKILTRLDHLDLIVDNSLWIIAQGYEKSLFGYHNLKERVVTAIERRSKFTSERVFFIIGGASILAAIVIGVLGLYIAFVNNFGG